MDEISQGFSYAFRDFNSDGVAASGLSEVDKSAARALGPTIANAMALIGMEGLADYQHDTKENADIAAVGYADGTRVLVWADPAAANNDLWIVASGSLVLTGLNGMFHDIIEALAQPYVDSAEEWASVAESSMSDLVKKIDYFPPSMPDTYGPVVNAVRRRYSSTSDAPENGTVIAATGISLPVPSSTWNANAWENRREPGVVAIDATATTAGATGPRYARYITLDDLAAIGVVPNDTTPPLMSFRAIIHASECVNQTVDLSANANGQMWIGLRYAGVGAALEDTAISAVTDTIFTDFDLTGAQAGPGNGDPVYSTVTATRTLVDGEKQMTKGGIPILATYGGNALTGIIIQFYGKATATGATKLIVGCEAAIAGSTIDIDAEYKNGKEDFPMDFTPAIEAGVQEAKDYADTLFGGAPTETATLVLNGTGGIQSYVESDISGDTIRRTFTPFPVVTSGLNSGSTGTPVVFNPNDDFVNGVLVKSSYDDAAPDHVFGTTLTANHGYQKGNLTMAAHGKTTDDIGSVWLKGGVEYIIVGIPSSSVVAMTERNGNGAITTGTFTHVSGATNTADIVATDVSMQQWYPPYQNRTMTLYIDGVEHAETTGTFTYATKVQFVETYEVLSKSEMVAWREAAAKADLTPTGRTPSYVRSTVYEYDRYGQLVIYLGWMILQATAVSDLMGMQAAASGFGGGGTAAAQYYMRNTLPFAYNGSTLDYSMIEPVTSVIGGKGTTSANFTSANIEAPVPYADSVVTLFDAGYIASMGWLTVDDVADDVRTINVSELALEIRGNTGKLYFRVLDKGDFTAQSGQFYSAVGYRYIGPKPGVTGRTNAHPVITSAGDRYYADWHDFQGIDILTLPTEFAGRKVVVESSRNAGLFGPPTGSEIKVAVSASGTYGFLVLRIED